MVRTRYTCFEVGDIMPHPNPIEFNRSYEYIYITFWWFTVHVIKLLHHNRLWWSTFGIHTFFVHHLIYIMQYWRLADNSLCLLSQLSWCMVAFYMSPLVWLPRVLLITPVNYLVLPADIVLVCVPSWWYMMEKLCCGSPASLVSTDIRFRLITESDMFYSLRM